MIANRVPRHVVVLGHPAVDSFNHAIAEKYCATVRACGQEAVLRDLYALDFDPCLHVEHRPGHQTRPMSGDVAGEIALLRGGDTIVFVYPMWFGMPPAIIKGYVDRVLGEALTPRDIAHDVPDAILHGKLFATLSTSATTRPWLDEQGQLDSLRNAFDRYLLKIFGMRDGGHTHFDAIVEGQQEDHARRNLSNVEEQARRLCAELAAEHPAAPIGALLGADAE
ncbi:NAD(P)H-dependent oxidoreductase [Sphingomonas sp. So64.6b]|uniref:NAD(P)H-dependent oxidoreductase n=1 Tax=Sphingomonas sp. So64.6b TaxID=2997354 RepID=UPI0016047DC2|nr:NAD(P)H-dependent oxidoreductase [Sphingomonas sp. So64.6b]QNA83721.1 NAD(P)H-dependent oxidoreductase [Sphingomonas sp. So64.6b]